jgi:L-alanine-DL-glutamate epimerase-like enolase superfamily enzyme
MTALSLEARAECWPLKAPVRIARQTYVSMDVVVAELTDADGLTGRGEAAGLPYKGETPATMLDQIYETELPLTAECEPEALFELLPPGGARNALDCALWDLRCKRMGQRAWQLAGLDQARPLQTALTFGIGDEDDMRRGIRAARHMPVIKLKANREHHVRLAEIAREEHPSARLLMDANGSWDRALLDDLVPSLHRLGVELVEQPVAVGQDATLWGYDGVIPLAADESCDDRSSLSALRGLYAFVNIKLDKAGGLTEALALANAAREQGFGLMVGNMGGTSLSMAAHLVVGQMCRFVDLDAPLLCRQDRAPALRYEGALVHPPERELWG